MFAGSSFPSQIVDDTSQRLGVARQTLAVQQPRKQTSAPLFVCSVLWNTFDHHSRHFQFAMLRTIEGMGCFVAGRGFKQPPHAARCSTHRNRGDQGQIDCDAAGPFSFLDETRRLRAQDRIECALQYGLIRQGLCQHFAQTVGRRRFFQFMTCRIHTDAMNAGIARYGGEVFRCNACVSQVKRQLWTQDRNPGI